MSSQNQSVALFALAAFGALGCRTSTEAADAIEQDGAPSEAVVFEDLTPPSGDAPEAGASTANAAEAVEAAEDSAVVQPAVASFDTAPLDAPSGAAAPELATTETPRAVAKAIPAAYGLSQDAPAQDEATEPTEATETRAGGPDVKALELAYFNTAEFRREFAHSWIARTDIEPPTSPEEVEDLRDIVDTATDGDVERAKEKLERALRRFPDSAQFRFLLGLLHFQDEEFTAAIGRFDEAIDLFPKFLRAHQNKALAHFALGTQVIDDDPRSAEEIAAAKDLNFELAADSFRAQLRLGGINGQTYGFLGVVLADQENYLEAETAFRSALLLQPSKELWRSGLVTTLLKQRDFGSAASLLDTLIAENPDNREYWKLQGSAYAGLEDLDSAARNLVVAQGLGDTDASSAFLLADIYTNQRHLELAADAYGRGVGLAAPDALARPLNGARQIMRLGAPEAAREVLTSIETTFAGQLDDETNVKLRKLQSQIAVRLGDAEGEIEILETIIDENPLDGEAMTLLAKALGRRGSDADLALAFQMFETAATIDGAGAMATLEHARLLVSQRRYADAVPLLKTSLQQEDAESVRAYLSEVEKAAKQSTR